MPRGKYTFVNDRIVNRFSGEAIPEDEPVFILRGRDKLAIKAIEAYLGATKNENEEDYMHQGQIVDIMDEFILFLQSKSEEMKYPSSCPYDEEKCLDRTSQREITMADGKAHYGVVAVIGAHGSPAMFLVERPSVPALPKRLQYEEGKGWAVLPVVAEQAASEIIVNPQYVVSIEPVSYGLSVLKNDTRTYGYNYSLLNSYEQDELANCGLLPEDTESPLWTEWTPVMEEARQRGMDKAHQDTKESN